MRTSTEACRFPLDKLARLLRGEGPAPEMSECEWLKVVESANDHRVLRAFGESVRHLGGWMPPAAEELLQIYERESAGFGLMQTAGLIEVLELAADADLRAIPLKGPMLLERLYGDPVRRCSSDLDFLVPELECSAFGEALEAVGYFEQITGDVVTRTWMRGALVIEVHTHFDEPELMPFDMESVWERAELGSFQGRRCWNLNVSDELLFLSLHAGRHGFQQLSWPLELGRAYELFADRMPMRDGRWDPDAGQGAATLPGILLLGQALAQRVSAQPVRRIAVEAPERVRRTAERIAEELWNAALCGRALNTNRLRAYGFVPRLETGAVGRARRMWRLLWMCSTRIDTAEDESAGSGSIRSKFVRWVLRQCYLLRKLFGGGYWFVHN